MTVTPWLQLFLDVPLAEWQRSVDFWSAATAWSALQPRGEEGQFTSLVPETGEGWVQLQAIDGAPRIHLDLDEPDRDATQARSQALGAVPAWSWAGVPVMRSPGGLLFCHTVEPRGMIDRSDPLRVLDQVCIDIPADLWETEIAFWRDITGRELTTGLEPEFAFLGADGALRVLLQRLGETGGEVRAHPDFAVADRPAETGRHVSLGAAVVRESAWWTVMRAPDGHVYCLTDRDPTTGSVRPR